MKLMWKLLLAVLVLSMLLPFTLLKDDAGGTLLKISNLKWPDWPNAAKNLFKASRSQDPGAKTTDTIYQWVDADGNMQFSNTMPSEKIEFSARNYDPELNVIQSINTKTNGVDESVVPAEDTPQNEFTAIEDLGSPYSADGIKKLLEDANNVEKLLNQRLQKQEAALGQ